MSLLTSLVSHWRLNESSGNRADAHGSNTLTNTNVGAGTGLLGTCADFENASAGQKLAIASNSTLQMGDIDFTFAVWVNAESFDSVGTEASWIMSKRDGSAPALEYQLLWRGTGGGGPAAPRFIFTVWNEAQSSTPVNADNLGTPSTGTWYFIVAWHDSVNNVVGIQINNGTANTAAHTTGVAASDSTFQLSGRSGSTNKDDHWDGLMESASLWKRVLTTAEKTTLYNAGAGLAYPWGAVWPTERSYPRGVNRGVLRGVA